MDAQVMPGIWSQRPGVGPRVESDGPACILHAKRQGRCRPPCISAVPMVEHGLCGGDYRDEIIRAGLVGAQQDEEGEIQVGEDLSRCDESLAFRP